MKKNQNYVTNNTEESKQHNVHEVNEGVRVIPANSSKVISSFGMLNARQEVLLNAPAPLREYIADCHLLYSGEKLCGFSIEDFIPKEAEKFYSIFCGDYDLMQKRFESREAAESEVPRDGSFYMVYENASVVYYRGVSETGVPVEEGVIYEDKMDAVRALLAYLKPILTQEVKAYSES